MMIASILVVCALIAAGVLLWALRGSRRTLTIEDLQPLDLEAFLNLVDTGEEEYLRRRLPAAQFRHVQRERLAAAIEYVSAISHNAGVLLQVGAATQRTGDQTLADAGRQLVDHASQVRLSALLAQAKLRMSMIYPGASLHTSAIVDRYREVTELADRLGTPHAPVDAAVNR